MRESGLGGRPASVSGFLPGLAAWPAQDLPRTVSLVLHGRVSSTPSFHADPANQSLAHGPGYVFSAHHNVLFAFWTAQGTGQLIDAFRRAVGAFVPLHPEGFSSVHVVANGLPLATSEARDALAALMKQYAGNLACAGTVLEGTGFWASATRGVIVSLQLLAPNTFAVRTCASVAELVAWIPKPHALRTGVVLQANELEQAIAQARTAPGS
jgi:hypothetical protein